MFRYFCSTLWRSSGFLSSLCCRSHKSSQVLQMYVGRLALAHGSWERVWVYNNTILLGKCEHKGLLNNDILIDFLKSSRRLLSTVSFSCLYAA